jgi:hypothetical protein
MTGKIEHVEVITSVQRRRRWSAEDKAAIVQETRGLRGAKGAVYVGNQLYRGPWCLPKSKWANPYKSRDDDRDQVSREISQSW